MAQTNGETDGETDGAETAAVTYGSYLALDEVLGAQRPRSDEHDEMLFIVIHQVYELWFKQLIHEVRHLQARLEAGDTPHALHTLKRVLTILKVAVAQVDVLETMTPRQFLGFRDRLQASSGFQSAQFRTVEFLLGLRESGHLKFQEEGSEGRRLLEQALARPSLWDEANAALARGGFDLPAEVLERDWSETYRPSEAVEAAWIEVYRDVDRHWPFYQLAEKLVDIDDSLATWRHKHVVTVERIIGLKRGTGGTAGVAYLQSTVGKRAFPELWSLRTRL